MPASSLMDSVTITYALGIMISLADGDGALGTAPDGVPNRLLAPGRDLGRAHFGVTVVGQVEHLRGQPAADPVSPAAIIVDGNLHFVNSQLVAILRAIARRSARARSVVALSA